MKYAIHCLCFGAALLLSSLAAMAQNAPLTFTTVERPPFSMEAIGERSGFSIDLTRAIAKELGRPIRFQPVETFGEMLRSVEEGRSDGAIANISITAAREQVMDFSQPIFESGLQIMLPDEGRSASLFSVIVTRDIAFFLLSAFGALFSIGMLMWVFERKRQPYFQRPFKEALFPSFWWALNLVVNGGFEERVPQTRVGRFFGVMLVVSSLFVVSIFVAKITAAMTVAAISENVDSINDIEGRAVATTAGSTGEAFLAARGIAFTPYTKFADMLTDFENGEIDAVVFDGPILAWYLRSRSIKSGRLVERVFKRENYGIALPTGSPLTEDINRALLTLRENGTTDELQRKYFGN